LRPDLQDLPPMLVALSNTSCSPLGLRIELPLVFFFIEPYRAKIAQSNLESKKRTKLVAQGKLDAAK
jgi:hypothetical protein